MRTSDRIFRSINELMTHYNAQTSALWPGQIMSCPSPLPAGGCWREGLQTFNQEPDGLSCVYKSLNKK